MRTRGNKDRCTMIKKMGIRERMERVRKTERKKRIQQADIETQRNTDRTNGVEGLRKPSKLLQKCHAS